MFEARLAQGGVLKKLSDVLKDFVDCHRMSSFDCSANGFGLQALDATHVTLVSVLLRSEGFNHYRCDRPVFLGLNVDALAHILKCANDDDVVTLKADDQGNMATFIFESAKQARVSEFELRLRPFDSKRLAIPDHPYVASVRMPSSTFQQICRDLSSMGDFMNISVTEDGAKFTAYDASDSSHITVRQSTFPDKPEDNTVVDVQEPIALNFDMREITSALKATPLSPVELQMMAEYPITGIGHISCAPLLARITRFYLQTCRMGDE